MVRTSLILDEQSLAMLRRLAKRMDASQSEVVRRSLRVLEQREASAPASVEDALSKLANSPSAQQSWRAIKAKIRRQRADRHAADKARG